MPSRINLMIRCVQIFLFGRFVILPFFLPPTPQEVINNKSVGIVSLSALRYRQTPLENKQSPHAKPSIIFRIYTASMNVCTVYPFL